CTRPAWRLRRSSRLNSLPDLVPPHGGGFLKPRMLSGEALAAECARARTLRTVHVSSREKGDLIMLGIGGFTPLEGFMSRADCEGVCKDYRTATGLFWPIPITLSVDPETARAIDIGSEVALADAAEGGAPLATMRVAEKYTVDKLHECKSVFRTADAEHPDASLARVSRQGRDRSLRRRARALAARQPETRRHPGPGAHARDRRADRPVLPSQDGTAGGLSARHAVCGSARGSAARAVPAELRLLASAGGPRPRRRGRLLRPVRCASHFRRDSGGLAGDPAAQDRLDLLVLQVRRHGLGADLPARRRRPP